MKSRFLELSADAIFNIAQDELRKGNIENSLGIPRCAQVSAPTSQRMKVYHYMQYFLKVTFVCLFCFSEAKAFAYGRLLAGIVP